MKKGRFFPLSSRSMKGVIELERRGTDLGHRHSCVFVKRKKGRRDGQCVNVVSQTRWNDDGTMNRNPAGGNDGKPARWVEPTERPADVYVDYGEKTTHAETRLTRKKTADAAETRRIRRHWPNAVLRGTLIDQCKLTLVGQGIVHKDGDQERAGGDAGMAEIDCMAKEAMYII